MESVSNIVLKALALLLVFIAPIQSIMLSTIALVVADTVTGVWAAFKEGKAITSHDFSRWVSKILPYLIGIISAHLIEKYMVTDAVPMVKTVAGLIAITEGKSIFENINRISGVDFWKLLLDKLQGTSIKLPDDSSK